MRNEFHRTSEQPPCARCKADDVIITGQMPFKDAFGQPIVIQLCRRCDADSSAGGALVRFFAEGGGKDTSRAEEGAALMFAWQREAMAPYGYSWVRTPDLN